MYCRNVACSGSGSDRIEVGTALRPAGVAGRQRQSLADLHYAVGPIDGSSCGEGWASMVANGSPRRVG